jgi:hypothetical protein
VRAAGAARQSGRRRDRQRPPDEQRNARGAQDAFADVGIAPCLVGAEMRAAIFQARVVAALSKLPSASRTSIDSLACARVASGSE